MSHKEKETSPLHGWVLVFWGQMTYIGNPVTLAKPITGPCLSEHPIRLKPAFEMPVNREPMITDGPRGPMPVMMNARSIRPIGNFLEIREIVFPAGVPVDSAENLSGKNRQEIANAIDQIEEQRRNNAAGIISIVR